MRGTCLKQLGTLLLSVLQTLGEGVDHPGPVQLLLLPLALELPHLLLQPLANLRLQQTTPPLIAKGYLTAPTVDVALCKSLRLFIDSIERTNTIKKLKKVCLMSVFMMLTDVWLQPCAACTPC